MAVREERQNNLVLLLSTQPSVQFGGEVGGCNPGACSCSMEMEVCRTKFLRFSVHAAPVY